jgi:hypothetical protein
VPHLDLGGIPRHRGYAVTAIECLATDMRADLTGCPVDDDIERAFGLRGAGGQQ